MNNATRFALFAALTMASPAVLFADEIRLQNGDRYSGEITEVTDTKIMLKTEGAGTITIERKYIAQTTPSEKVTELETTPTPAKIWSGEVALGYSQTTGNVQNKQADARFLANRKREKDELTFKAEATYGSQNKKMNTQKYYGMTRYAYSFSADKRWYQFFKEEVDHDRFSDIDLRSVTSTGLGYWWATEPDWKLLTEAGPGLEHTRYRSGQESTTEAIAVGRLFAEKKLWDKLKLSEDVTIYPSLQDTGEFRLRSESIIEYPFGDKLAGRLSLIDEYNSDPAADKKKNDVRLVSSLVYSF